jgi:hypothetical protein
VDLWSRLDAVKARWNVLEHPFYERWSAGELSHDDLARYAGQYRHAVVALAEAEHVLRANWQLLDGVERLCGRSFQWTHVRVAGHATFARLRG